MIKKRQSRKFASSRTMTGGVLPLLMLVAVIIAVLVLAAIAVCALHLVESKLRSTAENYVLQAGIQLNKDDRIGEINLMVERSREAVYTARKTLVDIESGAPHVGSLARLLLEDARVGAKQVDEERRRLSGVLGKEVEIALTSQVKKDCQAGTLNLMFFQLNQREDISVEVGSVRDMPSNAMAPVGLPQLKRHDHQEGYFFQSTDYYQPDINTKLPVPDDDLTFRFASLAPRIKNTVADARLLTTDDFDGQVILIAPGKLVRPTLRNLPSAVKLVTRTGVNAPMQLHQDLEITTISTSAGSDKVE
ncbi:MAG: hypothetical protein SGJ27_30180 [Candidatus Melainabacteria bacterium]|nr:hypothetical protein [Candidatus Melainabacteria bacterium]